MAHGYHTLQHWNRWLSHDFLGASLLRAEQQELKILLQRHFGKQVLLIGVPHQIELLESTQIPCQAVLGPIIQHIHKFNVIESDLHELPILTGSIDLVMLPHTLEFVDNPRQLLAETCRIIKSEGLVVICGFNPYSPWGFKKKLKKSNWSGNDIPASKIKNWLQLADFELEQQKYVLFRPPIAHQPFYQKLSFLERVGASLFPMLGGVYILRARAKVIPLTPIRMKWKQQLNGIRISTTISTPPARFFKT